jgi:hypothetical protein
MRWLAGGSLLLSMACGQGGDEAPVYSIEPLDIRSQLVRLSVDLRGIHPAEEELLAIEGDHSLYGDFVDRYLEDGRVYERVRDVWNLRFLTRIGSAHGYSADDVTGAQVARAMDDEALRLVSRIFQFDLPYTEVVLADHTMGHPILAEAFGLDFPEHATNWQPAHYTDGRPHAGVLTMNTVWLRYPSMGGNANRHRANAVSKMLLCEDYLERPVVLSRAAVDQLVTDPESAINENASCQSCHSTLDPLAAHFFGFFKEDDDDYSVDYQPEREEVWREYSGKPPAYFGQPTANLTELAQNIAADPRFTDCAVRTMWEGISQRIYADDDWSELQAHRQVFLAEGMKLRPLLRSIVMSETYRAASTDDPELAERLATVKTVSAGQLASIIEGLTGYRWTFGGVDGMTTHGMGLPVLAGGIDGDFVTETSYEASIGLTFIQERLAAGAGWHVATHDLDPERTDEAILLLYVTEDDTPDDNPEAFLAQMEHLYVVVTGEALPEDAEEPAALLTLWNQLYSVEASPRKAWTGVLTAVLRDPSITTY